MWKLIGKEDSLISMLEINILKSKQTFIFKLDNQKPSRSLENRLGLL